MTAAEARKAIVTAIGTASTLLGEVANAGLAHGEAERWLTLAIGAVGALGTVLGVYQVPNEPSPAAKATAAVGERAKGVVTALTNTPVLANGVAGYGDDKLLAGTPPPELAESVDRAPTPE